MKQPNSVTKPPSPPGPLDPHQFPLHAHTAVTAGREKVREVLHLPASRQSERLKERIGMGQTGT